MSDLARFIAKTRYEAKPRKGMNTVCRVWTGSTDGFGYGHFIVGSRTNGSRTVVRAHHWAWEEEHGPVPDGLCVLHRCDNPPCTRTSHLFLGTKKDNAQDMCKKGRHGTKGAHLGEAHHNAKLSSSEVASLKQLRRDGWTYEKLGELFRIHPNHASKIARGLLRASG